ncbi:ATP-binding protein [Mycolicibacter virginiensis]|uniref:ATP-binding protein n=1 Tax=Mycolicibacter virginiensis TaxID=1795032 RepID=UPI000695BC67|nr:MULTISPECIES: AAA family ATPase [Mycobacteriaceae]ULP48920.1 AAA family ATPase [Mycolicibacter virginiensis]
MTGRAEVIDFAQEITDTAQPLPEIITEGDRGDYEAELRRQRVMWAAREQIKQERAELAATGLVFPEPTGLADLFATEPEHEEWLVEGLLPADGSALLSAQFKSGKTTLAMNLVRSLTRAEPFLGQFGVPEPQRVAYFDLELGQWRARKWFQVVGPDPEMVSYYDLRGNGASLDIRVASLFDAMVGQLERDRIDVVIIDPVSVVCSSAGIDEDRNSEVRPLMDQLDAAVVAAGCKSLVVVHHAGHSAPGRARGASAFSDWGSALWSLERDGDKPAKFGARGRDVDVPKSELAYDPQTRLLARQWGVLGDPATEFFHRNRGQQLTTTDVMDGLAVGKVTAIRRLEEADGWEITTPAAGSSPAIWEYVAFNQDSQCLDPFS